MSPFRVSSESILQATGKDIAWSWLSNKLNLSFKDKHGSLKNNLTKLMKEKYGWWHGGTSLLLHNIYKPKNHLYCEDGHFLLSLQAFLLHNSILIIFGFIVQPVFLLEDSHSSWNNKKIDLQSSLSYDLSF